MSVTHDDVRHVAELARVAVDHDRLDAIVAELNGILAHMGDLAEVNTTEVEQTITKAAESTPLRSDSSGPLMLEGPREEFAPSMRDGFFLVPRLATHESSAEETA